MSSPARWSATAGLLRVPSSGGQHDEQRGDARRLFRDAVKTRGRSLDLAGGGTRSHRLELEPKGRRQRERRDERRREQHRPWPPPNLQRLRETPQPRALRRIAGRGARRGSHEQVSGLSRERDLVRTCSRVSLRGSSARRPRVWGALRCSQRGRSACQYVPSSSFESAIGTVSLVRASRPERRWAGMSSGPSSSSVLVRGGVFRRNARHPALEVAEDRGIGVLLDDERCARVPHEHCAYAARLYTHVSDEAPELGGHIVETAPLRANLYDTRFAFHGA